MSAGAPGGETRGAAAKRILLLHVRAGAGHESAARAVSKALETVSPGAETDVRDALDLSSHFLRSTYASTYNRVLARAPRVWGEVYKRSASPYDSWRQRFRTWLALWGSPKYLDEIARFRPDAILCTQFLPAEVLATWRERGKLDVPVATVITDFAVHPIWVYRGMDRYFVAADSVREELVDTGMVKRDRIDVTGVPIDPKFAAPIAPAVARRELGLDPDPSRPVFLLMGGGFGWGPIETMLDVVMELPPRVQALVVAGRNDRLRARLAEKTKAHADRIQIHGFTTRVELFLAASDLLLGKTGGLTVSEAMACGVPMVVFRPLPGQEERNCDFLQESGAAIRVHDYEELHYRLMHFIRTPERLDEMKERARRVGRPRSAFDVAEGLLRL
ncbi:MAG TPA: glycosyltransferase [Candidatus Eisenbacteria bacterium]|nr:glycosyltransferase [Candidatus Eisenbacteria bacterium]